MRKLLLTILVLLFLNGQAYGWGGWDTIKKLLSQANTWTGEQTFTDLKTTNDPTDGDGVGNRDFNDNRYNRDIEKHDT